MEKRKETRRRTIHFMKVYDQNSGELTGQLDNITSNGMRLLSAEPLEVGETYRFRIDLPESLPGDDTMTVMARAVWSKKELSFQFYDTGFAFVELSEKDRTVIDEKLGLHLFKD